MSSLIDSYPEDERIKELQQLIHSKSDSIKSTITQSQETIDQQLQEKETEVKAGISEKNTELDQLGREHDVTPLIE